MFTKNFKNLSKKDIAIAGGKGASLGEMTKAGISVPPGFVILAGAFDRFLGETDIGVEIGVALKKVKKDDINSVEEASILIRDIIMDEKFPKDIGEEILREYEEMKLRLVAVRSSATAEDSAVASWAGELESYLNVNEKNILESVKRCWASLFTPRAIFYRFEKKLSDSKISVAVVVQEMVQSEISGITFTVHPVTEDHEQMVIEAGYGLGEAIVGGMITPDTYIINKSQIRPASPAGRNSKFEINLKSSARGACLPARQGSRFGINKGAGKIQNIKQCLLDKNISEQKMMIVQSANGTKKMKVPAKNQSKQKLPDAEILELAELCLRIEKHYKKPQDIEWAYAGGKLYIVQSRPITTLKK
jgi:pyruvate, water dikinase